MFKRMSFLVAVCLAANLASGCGVMPTAPSVSSVATSPSAATQAPGPAQATPAPKASIQRTAEPGSLLGIVGGLLGGVIQLVFRVLNLVGSIGGTLTNGRWRVEIPANAVDGNATVKLGVPSSSSSGCSLDISPADKNHFSVPVMLVVDCRNVPLDVLKTYSIYWYNPTTSTWVAVSGSKVDLTNKTVSAPLQHFSTYSVAPNSGKAGW
jgi:hypothetical protein